MSRDPLKKTGFGAETKTGGPHSVDLMKNERFYSMGKTPRRIYYKQLMILHCLTVLQ